MRREFYLQDDQSNKFWTIEVVRSEVVTTNGRIGAKPRETRTGFASPQAANAAADKEILAKRRKGYLEGNLSSVPPYRKGLPPRFVRINHDDYDARYVGKLADGRQFFLTHPFAPAQGNKRGGSFIALYQFDEFGMLTDARIEQLGEVTQTGVDEMAQTWLTEMGPHRFGDIRVAPFAIDKYGHQFGLIFDAGEAEADDEDGEDDEDPSTWVTVEPGNYMAFYPPWDGDYDT